MTRVRKHKKESDRKEEWQNKEQRHGRRVGFLAEGSVSGGGNGNGHGSGTGGNTVDEELSRGR